MVAADFALLSFAVLSAIGFGTVRAGKTSAFHGSLSPESETETLPEARLVRFRGRLERRDETDSNTYNTLIVATDSVATSIPVVASTPKPPPRVPTKVATVNGNTPTPVSTSLDLGHADGNSGSSTSDSSSDVVVVTSLTAATETTYNTLQSLTDSVTSIVVVAPTVKPPTRPGKTTLVPSPGTVTLDLGHGGQSVQEDGNGGSGSSTTSPTLVIDSTTTYQTLQTATDIVTNIPVGPPTVKPPVRPGQATTVKPSPASLTLDLGHGGGSSEDETSVLSSSTTSPTLGVDMTTTYQTLQSEPGVATNVPPVVTTKPPPRPGKVPTTAVVPPPVSISLDLGHGASDVVDSAGSTLLSTIGIKATVSLSYLDTAVTSTTSSADYFYPGEFGSDWTLTTDSSGIPTRTVLPSKSSIVPHSSTRIGPPPADTWTYQPESSQTSTVAESEPTDGFSYGAGPIVGTSTLTGPTKATAPPTRAGGKSTTRSSAITLDFGHTPTGTDLDENTNTFAPSASVVRPTIKPSPAGPPVAHGNSTRSYSNSTTTFVVQPTYPITTWALTISETATTNEKGSTVPLCQPTDSLKPVTTYSIVYTSTITWYGTPGDYKPPYPTISTPEPCVMPKTPLRLTMSYCAATGTATGSDMSKFISCQMTTATLAYSTAVPGFSGPATITFVTTDKNPTVVYSSIETPGYGLSQPGTKNQVEHTSATPPPESRQPAPTPGYTPPQSQVITDHTQATQPVTVAVQPSAVVINSQTFSDNPAAPTQTVTAGGQTFTINPTQVVGAGQTIQRPAATGGVFVQTPTSTQIAGIQVSVSSSVAVVGGTSFTLGPVATTAVVSGQTVIAGPSGVVVAGTTIAVTSVPTPTQVIIEGGELITAVGASVIIIHGTTITYGPASTPSTTVVDNDTITIGPQGVTVHGTTLGGSTAKPGSTQYEIVGGATITQIGPSVVVINNATYTVGPGTGSTTTVVGGKTITIGPSGVSVSTYSIPYPFGPTTTITPAATGVAGTAAPTASKDAGFAVRPPSWTWLSCIAIGVLGLAL